MALKSRDLVSLPLDSLNAAVLSVSLNQHNHYIMAVEGAQIGITWGFRSGTEMENQPQNSHSEC